MKKLLANPHADQVTFRKWLIKQLKMSRFSAPAGEDPRALAERIGVTFDVLKSAIELRRADALIAGKPRGGRALLLPPDYQQFYLNVYGAARRDLDLLLKTLRIAPAALLRSVAHHFLMHPFRPRRLSESWMYQGKAIEPERPFRRISTRITRGASIALERHAHRWNVTCSCILRGLVTEVLEGRLRKFKIIGFSEMFGDPDRYVIPELFW
jgi:hypothetical protein